MITQSILNKIICHIRSYYSPHSTRRVASFMDDIPSFEQIQKRTNEVFGVRPCLWQSQIVQSILQRKNDVVSIAGTGMGKTLVFWIPILFRPPGSVQIIVTPLNLLGSQNVLSLERVGIKAVMISGDSATAENFRVSLNANPIVLGKQSTYLLDRP
jgi:DEAD/DEAH box helicase